MNMWTISNCLKRQKELFFELGVPLTIEEILHT
jgi:hypothetical protein